MIFSSRRREEFGCVGSGGFCAGSRHIALRAWKSSGPDEGVSVAARRCSKGDKGIGQVAGSAGVAVDGVTTGVATVTSDSVCTSTVPGAGDERGSWRDFGGSSGDDGLVIMIVATGGGSVSSAGDAETAQPRLALIRVEGSARRRRASLTSAYPV